MILRKGKNILSPERIYKLIHKGKVLKPNIKRVRGAVDIKNKLINRLEIGYDQGYFIISEKGFNTMLWGFKTTVIVLNKDHYVIEIIEDQQRNKIISPEKYPDAWKYVILPKGMNSALRVKVDDKLDVVRDSLSVL